MSPTDTLRNGIGRPRASVERRPFGPTIPEPADALRRSATRTAPPDDADASADHAPAAGVPADHRSADHVPAAGLPADHRSADHAPAACVPADHRSAGDVPVGHLPDGGALRPGHPHPTGAALPSSAAFVSATVVGSGDAR